MSFVRRNKRWNVLHYYLITYLLVLFVPLVICCVYYIRVISMISEDDIKRNEMELRHASVSVDSMLDEITYLGHILASNAGVNIYEKIKQPFAYANAYKITELQNSLPNLLLDRSVFDYGIFFNNSEIMINKKYAYRYEEFYNLYLRKQSSSGYDDWLKEMKESRFSYGLEPAENYIYQNGIDKKLLVYTCPVLNYSGGSAVRIYMEESTIEALMPVISEGGIQYIQDNKGRVMYVKSKKDEITESAVKSYILSKMQNSYQDNEISYKNIQIYDFEYLDFSYFSEETRLGYHVLYPMDLVNSRKASVVWVLLALLFLGGTVGIVLSIYLSRKNATPINDILKEALRNTEEIDNNQSFLIKLKDIFKNLSAVNTTLSEEIEQQRPFIKNAFFNRLLYGTFQTEQEVKKTADYIGMDIDKKVFCVLLLVLKIKIEADQILTETDRNLMNACVMSLLEAIKDVLPETLYANHGDGQVALLLELPESEADQLHKAAEHIAVKIKEKIPTDISQRLYIYGGSIVNKLIEIHESFNNVSMYHREEPRMESVIVWYTANTADVPLYPPADIAVRLTHYVTAGDQTGLHDILGEIVKKYIVDNTLPAYLQHMLLNELQTIMFRIIGKIDIPEKEYQKYYLTLEKNDKMSLLSQISNTLNLFRDVCGYVDKQKHLKDGSLIIPSIVSFIMLNYGDYNLSLASVAEMFGVNETYLSLIFKQQMNVNFSVYIEQIRMEKAKDILENTELPINKITYSCGYYSVNSFCRAFKRVVGISASEYRNKYKNK